MQISQVVRPPKKKQIDCYKSNAKGCQIYDKGKNVTLFAHGIWPNVVVILVTESNVEKNVN